MNMSICFSAGFLFSLCVGAVMEKGWLEEHGRPLEAMSVDMAQIERKNNKLDVQWRNYQVRSVII